MLKRFAKNVLIALLLILVGSRLVYAEIKNYQYDGKMPFVQMMLTMMTAMGILDRIPTNGRYGRYGGSGFSNSPWTQPYLNGGGWGGNALNNTGFDGPWGNPSWGVLPPESYALDGWVNESWENSVWNSQRQAPQSNTAPPQNVDAQQYPSGNAHSASPLARIAPPNQSNQPNQQSRQGQPTQSYRQGPEQYSSNPTTSPLNNVIRQKPCVTDDCGLKKPSLNGLWVSRDGEMLGIKNNDYLWSDGASRHLTGKIKMQNEYLLTSVDGHEQLMRFKYKLSGDYLLTMQPDGQVREFTRMSPGQYQSYNRDYQPGLYPNNYQGY